MDTGQSQNCIMCMAIPDTQRKDAANRRSRHITVSLENSTQE